jgi:hypothetical protein
MILPLHDSVRQTLSTKIATVVVAKVATCMRRTGSFCGGLFPHAPHVLNRRYSDRDPSTGLAYFDACAVAGLSD